MSDYEASRQERLKQNAAKLAELQIASAATQARDAAVEAEKQRVAEKQASRDRLTAEAGPRRASSRTAAARTATKLRQQARSGRSGDDGASSSDEGSADRQQHGGQRGRMAAGEYDPLDDAEGGSSSDSRESLANSSASEADDARPARRHRPAARPEARKQRQADHMAAGAAGAGPSPDALYAADQAQEDAQLHQALSLADAGGGAAPFPAQGDDALQPAAEAIPAAGAAELYHQRHAISGSGGGKMSAKSPAAKRKAAAKAPQDKRRRREAAPPSDEDVLAAFELFNRQGMSAIIDSDIAEVASDTLGVDLELVQLHNMMARACDLLHLQQARLAIGDFTRLVRHFCG